VTLTSQDVKPGQIYIGQNSGAIYFILEKNAKGVKQLKAHLSFTVNEIDTWDSLRRAMDPEKPDSKKRLVELLFIKKTIERKY